MSEIISKEQLKKIVDETLTVTNELFILKGTLNTGKAKFKPLLTVIFKRAYVKLYSIRILADDEHTGDSIMALSRSLLEELISVSFMEIKGKDKMAQKFVDYMYVDKKLENDVMLSMGMKVDEAKIKQDNKDYDTVAKQFLRSDGQIARSWAKCSTEDMLKELIKAKAVTPYENDVLTQGYIMGNRKIHLSPYDLVSYFNTTARTTVSKVSEELGMMISLLCIIALARGLAREERNSNLLKKIKIIDLKLGKILKD